MPSTSSFASAAMPTCAARNRLRRAVRAGPARAALLIAAGVALTLPLDAARAGTLGFRCTNPASGASWLLAVDPDRRTVDSFPATITDKSISWHDPKEGFYALDRASGALEFRNASSTGGYFLHYNCHPEQPPK